MNTNSLKKFAQDARRKLIEQVGAKMELVLTSDSAELREKADQVKKLQEAINSSSKEQIIDKVAYTWFNRLMALRFMDVNDYQPLGIRIVTPKEGYSLPEILDEAKQGVISDELPVKHQHVYDILDGNISSSNSQNEAFKELLVGACNHLNKVFPFLFERINDYTELLLPDDLTSEFSIVQDIRDGMTPEDCQEVEIIGWIYQFYISEKKDEVFASKKNICSEDIPAATQLFTPRWIVEYMVQNTVGKLWLRNRPNSRLQKYMPYLINSDDTNDNEYVKLNSVEELTVLDQACGSGHILVYGFELLFKIYEEEGYNPSEIPQLIIENNLFGFEIDERASQLAGLALMLKARSYQRRFFKKEVVPNMMCYQDLELSEQDLKEGLDTMMDCTEEMYADFKSMNEAKNFGSLIKPRSTKEQFDKAIDTFGSFVNDNDIFRQNRAIKLLQAAKQLSQLTTKFHCVVDNPPYMGNGNMNKSLTEFVRLNYPASKTDLMACFMEAGIRALVPSGYLGMINQHTWMFLSSYEKLREQLIKDVTFDTLLHLGPRTFPEIGGEVVQNASFTLINNVIDKKASYIRLVDFETSELKRVNTLDAIRNPESDLFYITNQKGFIKIPGSPIVYWISDRMRKLFDLPTTDEFAISEGQNITGNNDKFIRFTWEVNNSEVRPDGKFPIMAKGGEGRKWFGSNYEVINWSNQAREEYRTSYAGRIQSKHLWFRYGITWPLISGNFVAFRLLDKNWLYNKTAPSLVFDELDTKEIKILLAFFNSKISAKLLSVLNPTISTNIKEVLKLPYDLTKSQSINFEYIEECLSISENDWNTNEVSNDFQINELLRRDGQDFEESFDLYKQFWTNKFFKLHKNEEEINRYFLKVYDVADEINPDIPLEHVTILNEVTSIVNNQLNFNGKEICVQFISYVVGCMFGRYSLDKRGLILANQGDVIEDYLNEINKSEDEIKFLPDVDNIVPVLDDEWFEDDITGRFKEFVEVTFGKQNLDKNIAFIEECIGKPLRKYFTKDFYGDHIKRYKKRPIYWMFSSPSGAFNVLIYMHRYTPDTLNQILNDYLKEYREKLNTRMEHMNHLIQSGSSSEQTKASKEKDKLQTTLLELQEYEREVLYPLATERVSIDLDEGVLVNYNKLGKAIKEVKGLNDKKTKEKVRKFDWINTEEIR